MSKSESSPADKQRDAPGTDEIIANLHFCAGNEVVAPSVKKHVMQQAAQRLAELHDRLYAPSRSGQTPRTDAIYCPEFGMILHVDPAEGYEHARRLERELNALRATQSESTQTFASPPAKQRAEAERIAWDTIKEYGCHVPERNDVKLAKAFLATVCGAPSAGERLYRIKAHWTEPVPYWLEEVTVAPSAREEFTQGDAHPCDISRAVREQTIQDCIAALGERVDSLTTMCDRAGYTREGSDLSQRVSATRDAIEVIRRLNAAVGPTAKDGLRVGIGEEGVE